jgi:tRNA-dihydrouridine synthase B
MLTTLSENLSKKIQSRLELFSLLPTKNLGPYQIQNRFVLAPMAGITHAPFRRLMCQLGAGIGVSELVSAKGIVYGNEHTLKMLTIHSQETNLRGLQIFGDDASDLAQAALVAEKQGAHFVDLNMGCPVNKVTKRGGGASLMRDPSELNNTFAKITDQLKIPFTIKIRTGWDHSQQNALEICQMAEKNKVTWVSIHGRTRAQGYSGKANWDFIEDCAKNSVLPIMGNGDLIDPIVVAEKLKKSHCFGLMIGRGILNNPFLFLESIEAYSKLYHVDHTQDLHGPFMAKDLLEVAYLFQGYLLEHFDERKTLILLKKHFAWWIHSLPKASQFRAEVFELKSLAALILLLEEFIKPISEEVLSSFRSSQVSWDEVSLGAGHG